MRGLHRPNGSASSLVSRAAGSLGRTPILISAAVGLCAGDVSAGNSTDGLSTSLVVGVAGSGAALLVLWRYAAWRRVAVGLLAFAFGYFAADRVYHPILEPSHVAHITGLRKVHIAGTITEDPEARGTGARIRIRTEQVDGRDGWRAATGDVLMTVRQLTRPWEVGDCIRARLSLRRPRNFGNPGEFDYEGYLARRGIYVTAFAGNDLGFERADHHVSSLVGPLARWRRRVAVLFDHELPRPSADVMKALIVGSMGTLPADLRDAFSRAGVSHVLSISGLHIGLVAAAGYAMFRWLLARSRWVLLVTNVPKIAVGLSIIPVMLYASIAGSNVATVRSVIMVVVFLTAVGVDRQRHLLVSLAVAAIAILVWAPGSGRDISFQLSFAAVLGLMYGTERFQRWWAQWEEDHLLRLRGWRGRVWRSTAVSTAVSVSALAATLPLTALHFNQVSFIALIANAVVVPLLGSIAVALGLLAALFEPLVPVVAQCCALAAYPFVAVGVWSVRVLATVPGAVCRVPTPTVFELALGYAMLLTVVRFAGTARRYALLGLTLVAMADAAWWYAQRYHHSDLRVTFLSVGQGDSAVVELPYGAVMVVDGGGLMSDSFDVGERILAPFLWSRKILHVDYLVISHPDWDHYGGLAFLAAHFGPDEFWTPGTAAPSPRFTHLEQILSQTGVRRVVLHGGTRRQLGPVTATVYSPPMARDGLSLNDQSLVFRLELGSGGVLFSGDIEAVMEHQLASAQGDPLASTVLKVPHHGSRTSSSAAFLAAVSPRIAVASLGFENRFGFPHREVVERYAARATRLARTDRDGAVELRISSDGSIIMQTHRQNSETAAGDPAPHVSEATSALTLTHPRASVE
jgi:competence protein ComEC